MACSQLSSRAVFRSKKDLWSLLFRYAICKAALASFLDIISSQSCFRIPQADCKIIHAFLASLPALPSATGLWENRLQGVFCVIERDDRPVSLASGQLFTGRKTHLSPKWVWLGVSDPSHFHGHAR